MFAEDQYRLLDFGKGRKLERFGLYVVDRPAPAGARQQPAQRELWQRADARYERTGDTTGRWLPAGAPAASWTLQHGRMVFELRRTPFGHVGVFPEQAVNWDWLADRIAQAGRPLHVLNLFAYTGGATLACAAAGAQVVHVDAARNVVRWARRNAVASGLSAAPIRWIVEDAARFVRREVQRGSAYDAVVLDPPTYGHGPRGESWKIADDLSPLLAGCLQLTRDRLAFLLVTCHTPSWDAVQLRRVVQAAGFSRRVSAAPLVLISRDGRTLPSGVAARCVGDRDR